MRLFRFNHALLPLLLSGLTACSPGTVKQSQTLDFSHVERIDFRIVTHDPSDLPIGIKQQVIENLTTWHYPVGATAAQNFSHVLTASVGKVTQGSTPAGFSFSAGNSDPRAVDFQKMSILPISCRLSALATPAQNSELSMGFTATDADRSTLNSTKLSDHISTVCFNLLQEVNWPMPQQPSSLVKTTASWIPEVQIETRETPVETEKTATGVRNEKSGETRKKVIIHNHGAPVILQFGYERR